MREEARAARAMADLTRRERLPEVSAGVVARNYSGNGEFRQGELVVRLSLPWFNQGKYRSATRRDEARAKAAELDAVDYAAELREEVHGLTVKIEAARREALVYRDEIIPRSETAIESARAAWESGRGMFRDVLEARRMLIEARLMHARAVTEQYEMLSDLVLCCGLGDLEALKMLEDKLKDRTGRIQTMKTKSLWKLAAAGAARRTDWLAWSAAAASPRASATATDAKERKVLYYQSAMHPWIKSDKPGRCTICGMELTPVYEGEAGLDTTRRYVAAFANDHPGAQRADGGSATASAHENAPGLRHH